MVDDTVGRGVLDEDVVARTLELLQEFGVEMGNRPPEADIVDDQLDTVLRESSERLGREAENVYEDALVAAARLWEAGALDRANRQMNAFERVVKEAARMDEPDTAVSVTAIPKQPIAVSVADVGDEADNVSVTAVPSKLEPMSSSVGSEGGQTGVIKGTNQLQAESGHQTQAATFKMPRAGVGHRKLKPATDMKASDVELSEGSEPQELTSITTIEPEELEFPDAAMAGNDVALDATVVSESIASTLDERFLPQQADSVDGEELDGSRPVARSSVASGETTIEVVTGGNQRSVVDTEAEVEDDASELGTIFLKVLDVSALLLEKILFVGLPTILSGGALVWERVDNATNGAKGRKGWRLLKTLKKYGSGGDRGADDR